MQNKIEIAKDYDSASDYKQSTSNVYHRMRWTQTSDVKRCHSQEDDAESKHCGEAKPKQEPGEMPVAQEE